MRLMAIVLPVAVLAIGSAAMVRSEPVQASTVVPVNVTITCTGDGVQFSISPYRVRLNVGDDVDWRLVNSPNVTEFSIDRKAGKPAWPFTDSPPYRGGKDNPAKARRMDPKADGTYPYNIAATCSPADGSQRYVVIDPDMIVVRGGGTAAQ
jgi:hypothetical protein